MAKRAKTQALELWMNAVHVGRWIVTSQGLHELHYDDAWISSDQGRPISLSMPLRPAEPYKGDVVRNYFENLLPDNLAIRRRIAERFRTKAEAFDLLSELGRDCVGALQILPEGVTPRPLRMEATRLTDEEMEKHLSRALVQEPFRSAEEKDAFRISLAGNQEKTAFLFLDGRWSVPHGATPTSHILKFALGTTPRGLDLTTSVENEWLCGRILAAYDMPCARTDIRRFGKHKVLTVERFDRVLTAKKALLRLPQEDFAQIAGVDPSHKYEEDGGPGIRKILDQLTGSSRSLEDRKDFFRTQVLFWMLAAIDGHAKNFSVFIRPRGEFLLTPRYDVLSAYPVLGKKASQLSPHKIKMAMAVWGKNRHYKWAEMRRRHFEHTGLECNVPDTKTIIDELLERTSGAITRVKSEIPANFPEHVATSILAGLETAAKSLESDARPSPKRFSGRVERARSRT